MHSSRYTISAMLSRPVLILFTLLALPHVGSAQSTSSKLTAGQLLDDIAARSALTQGRTPFHAVLAITGPSPQYSAEIDLTWLAQHQFRLRIASPAFHQLRIVNGDQAQEQTQGDYYPRWLQTFVDALLDPAAQTAIFRNRAITQSSLPGPLCISRDDRPQGITDQLTWGTFCVVGAEPLLTSLQTFTTYLELSDYRSFGNQQIARNYATSVLDYKPVNGHLAKLEEIDHPDLTLFAITTPTPAPDLLTTTFVSTSKEESLMDHPPAFNWPPVREGKTDGYMIVYARTDRSGQVRETAKHNSDNPGLEQFGMEQALTLKFHPLVVDGVPQQMEMPLVLHFKTTLSDPLPTLDDREMRTHISGCSVSEVKPGKPAYRIKLSINEQGKLTGEGFPDSNTPGYQSPTHFADFRSCRFSPLLVNGKPTYYHGILNLPR